MCRVGLWMPIKEVDGQMFICADHGNAEQLIDETTGEPFTAHTTNQVPFIIVNADPSYGLREGGCLADIAPTLIEMMGMKKPEEMTGSSLLIKNKIKIKENKEEPKRKARAAYSLRFFFVRIKGRVPMCPKAS